jgi:hypothetical protein
MLQRLTVIGVLAGVLALGPLAFKAEPHYIIISGALIYHSIDCQAVLKEVLDTTTNPALGVCSVVGTVIETECANPNGKIVRGTASYPKAFSPVAAEVTQDLTKKGKAAQAAGHLKVPVIPWDPDLGEVTLGLTDQEAGCNNNWSVTKALLRAADVTIDVYPCGAECDQSDINDANRASTALVTCILPEEYTLDNLPTAGVKMTCALMSATHYF